MVYPAGEKQTETTESLCPSKFWIKLPVFLSHNLTELSFDPDNISSPPLLKFYFFLSHYNNNLILHFIVINHNFWKFYRSDFFIMCLFYLFDYFRGVIYHIIDFYISIS